jgi:hypothetical protein
LGVLVGRLGGAVGLCDRPGSGVLLAWVGRGRVDVVDGIGVVGCAACGVRVAEADGVDALGVCVGDGETVWRTGVGESWAGGSTCREAGGRTASGIGIRGVLGDGPPSTVLTSTRT